MDLLRARTNPTSNLARAALGLLLGACACDSGESSFGRSSEGNPGTTGPSTMGGTDERHVRAEVTLADESVHMYDAGSILIDGACGGVLRTDDPEAFEANYTITIHWAEGTMPSLGVHATGDEEGVDLAFARGGDSQKIGPADPDAGRGGTVTFDQVGDVVSGTFEGKAGAGAPESIMSVTSGTFRCTQ